MPFTFSQLLRSIYKKCTFARYIKDISTMKVKTFVCNMLHENCYFIYDEASREAAIIDPGFYWDEEIRQFEDYMQRMLKNISE